MRWWSNSWRKGAFQVNSKQFSIVIEKTVPYHQTSLRKDFHLLCQKVISPYVITSVKVYVASSRCRLSLSFKDWQTDSDSICYALELIAKTLSSNKDLSDDAIQTLIDDYNTYKQNKKKIKLC